MEFNAEKVKEDLAQWIRDWFMRNGKDSVAVLGISGGKDSSVAAAICAYALGKDRVVGVLMPNGEQADIDVARALVQHLDIKSYEINIKNAFDGIADELEAKVGALTPQARQNLSPRLRMSTVYAVSQMMNGRVVNTCNLSEDWVGYSTRYGDSVGDFSPLSHLTVQEVIALGRALGLPSLFVDKVPSDGLCGKTDEDNLGFTYAVLDKYIRTGICENVETKALIDKKHRMNKFKLELMESFPYEGTIAAED